MLLEHSVARTISLIAQPDCIFVHSPGPHTSHRYTDDFAAAEFSMKGVGIISTPAYNHLVVCSSTCPDIALPLVHKKAQSPTDNNLPNLAYFLFM